MKPRWIPDKKTRIRSSVGRFDRFSWPPLELTRKPEMDTGSFQASPTVSLLPEDNRVCLQREAHKLWGVSFRLQTKKESPSPQKKAGCARKSGEPHGPLAPSLFPPRMSSALAGPGGNTLLMRSHETREMGVSRNRGILNVVGVLDGVPLNTKEDKVHHSENTPIKIRRAKHTRKVEYALKVWRPHLGMCLFDVAVPGGWV